MPICPRCDLDEPTNPPGLCPRCSDEILDEGMVAFLGLEGRGREQRSVLDAYRASRLLVRTIPRVFDHEDFRWSFTDVNREMELHRSRDRFQAASTSLIVPGVSQYLYHATGMRYGFLYNAETATLHKLNTVDANKSEDDGKVVIANPTLPLFRFVGQLKGKGTNEHNEVVATLGLNDLVGIVLCKLDSNNQSANCEKIEVVALRGYLRAIHAVDVEIYCYDETTGALSWWDPASVALYKLRATPKLPEPDFSALQERILKRKAADESKSDSESTHV
ncbi:hypothetical protein LY474_02000 [Myxococcus stipitatus]|uniref:hypothetical protein n=1 Tax=Myxococcus stipitatus TaxID=83455 RepID=UPI001F3363D1|nr:hypothetical protein [Myxococcus stipitatus]MCE9666573.1 hypothetical protein [Myxococcus stipitatus]